MAYQNDDYIAHYGIRGQKWGFRRFQNEDRTLTEAGKERYNKAKDSDEKASKKEDKPESSKWKTKDAKYLSDDELNRRNSRLQRERQYADLTKSRGKKFLEGTGKAFNKILIGSLIGASAGLMAKHYKELLSAGEAFIGNAAWMPINLDNLR